jgi:hypothetical protein
MTKPVANLAEVRLVLNMPTRVRNRKALHQAHLEVIKARFQFSDRATAVAWARLVYAARRLNREVKAADRARAARERSVRPGSAEVVALDK